MKKLIRKLLLEFLKIDPQLVKETPTIKYQLFDGVKDRKFKDGYYKPFYATEGSAGIDLIAAHNATIEPNGQAWIKSGIGFEIPKGYCSILLGRSGFAAIENITAYHIGLIDSDFTGQITIALQNNGDKTKFITAGNRIAQLLIVPYLHAEFIQTEQLNHTKRGQNGFGSTGVTI